MTRHIKPLPDAMQSGSKVYYHIFRDDEKHHRAFPAVIEGMTPPLYISSYVAIRVFVNGIEETRKVRLQSLTPRTDPCVQLDEVPNRA